MRICVPIMAKDTEEAVEKIVRANDLADLLELRLDLMKSFRLNRMVRAAARPVIATYRSEGEGGMGSADPVTRARYLLDAVEAGVEFVDVEFSMPPEIRKTLFQVPRHFGIILSRHEPGGTPGPDRLEDTLRHMVAQRADMVKIVTLARSVEDNLRVLALIGAARKQEVELIAFCMGPLGRMSRIASPLLGGYLTFASLERNDESADGQIPVTEMRRIREILTE